MQQIYHHTFANGFTLVAERMDHVRSAAFYFLVPAGCIHDPPQQRGIASVLAELITRGAGPRDSRELSTALDSLGGQRWPSPACGRRGRTRVPCVLCPLQPL